MSGLLKQFVTLTALCLAPLAGRAQSASAAAGGAPGMAKTDTSAEAKTCFMLADAFAAYFATVPRPHSAQNQYWVPVCDTLATGRIIQGLRDVNSHWVREAPDDGPGARDSALAFACPVNGVDGGKGWAYWTYQNGREAFGRVEMSAPAWSDRRVQYLANGAVIYGQAARGPYVSNNWLEVTIDGKKQTCALRTK